MKKYSLLILLLLLVSGFYNGLFWKTDDESLFESISFSLFTPQEQREKVNNDTSSLAVSETSIENVSLYAIGNVGNTRGRKFDNPEDNVFAIELTNALHQSKVWQLSYQVRGVGVLGVVRAINDELSVGGRLVEPNEQWQQVVEKIHVEQLRNGRNIIRFSVPDGADYGYEIKDVKLKPVFGSTGIEPILTAPFKQGHFTYWRGYLDSRFDSLQWSGTTLARSGEQFEYVWHDSIWQNNHSSIQLVYHQGAKATQFKRKVVALKGETSMIFNANNERRTSQVLALPNEKWHLSLSGIEVNGPVGSIYEPKVITVTALRKMDMPPMGAGMINVTAHAAGFRLLPHNSTFNANLQVAIGIDTALLPAGYSTKHVRTYFFDEKANKWTLLPKDSLQNSALQAFALTNHFTDFINAIIKQPELPTTQAYTPTQFSDLKAANPLEGITSISPPTANNNGTVNLSLPIDVPAGRKGLQPQLALQFSSEGGSGWLGLGWSLNIPTINVDTRWGVPRYNPNLETESYTHNGEELQWIEGDTDIQPTDTVIHPLFHRAPLVARNTSSSRRFILRVEGKFQKILRHGNSPSTYWWEVKDKNGTTYFYGKYSNNAGVNQNCILGKDGKIGVWALTEVKDVHGNFMRYYYSVDQFSGRSNDPTPGRQLYLDSVVYTGYGQTNGFYKVVFQSTNHDTVDVSINARYGFKEVSARRLQFIRTYYKNRIIKTYELSYKTGYFNKRMLCFVLESSNPAFTSLTSQMRDAICEKEDPQVVLPPGVRFHRFIHFKNGLDNNFDYDEVPISDANVNIAQPSDVKGLRQFVGNSQLIDLPFSDDDRKDNSNLLGTSQSFSIGGQGSLYLGLGANPITKNLSLSGSYSFSHNSNRTFVSFMDIDGDGYPDRVYRDGNAIFYQKLSYVNGQPQLGIGQLVHGLQSLGSQTSNSNGWGIQGVAGIGLASGNRSFNYTTTKGTTKRYFADVDGDGLSDFVDDGEVKFNKLNSYGEIEFIQPEGDTIYIGGSCGYIVHNGAINDSISIGLPNNDDLDWERRMMSHQPVRMWKAPYKGSITINAPIQLVEDTSESRKQATSPDGVSYTIQHNSNQLYKGHISANDYTVKNFTQTSLSVDVGDQIYFRLLPKFTRTWDNVLWSPSIEYTSYSNGTISGSNLNSDSLEAFKFEADNEFWVYEKRQTKMPFTANVRLHGTITSPPISDTLRFFILNNAGSLIHESFFSGSNGISFQMDQTISVNEDDTLYFGASSNTRIGYERVKFDLMLDYLSIPNYPGYDVNSEVDRVRIRPLVQFDPYNREVKPSLGHVSSNSMSHSITPVMSFGSAVSGKVILSVKKNNAVVTEQTYEIASGQVVAPVPLTYTASTGSKYFYEFHSRDFSLSQAIESSRVLRQMGSAIDTLSAGFYGVWHDSLSKFGPLYRGWGYFVYNVDTINPIDESRLIMLPYFADTNRIKIIDPQTFANDTANILNQTPSQSNTSLDLVLDNLLDAGFYTMIAYPEESCYRGIGNLTTIKPTTVSNWFEVENAIEQHYENPIPVLGGGRSPKAIRKTTKQRSWTNGASIGISSLANASGSRATTEDRTMVEYMDLNGDRFPDIVGEKYTQFSMPTGGLFPNVVSMAINHNNKEYGNGEQASTSRSGNLGGTAMRFEKEKGTKGRTLSNGGGASTGSNQAAYSYLDINGDGLPDKVNNLGEVALNIGYGFEGFVNWGFSGISSSSFASGNLGLDFQVEKGQNSWALGAGLTGGFSTTEATPVDINGDGLIDFMNQSIVWTNTGNGFIARPFSSTPPTIPRSENFSVSANVSGTFGTTFLVAKAGGSVSVNLGYSKSYERGQFIDMNNDGFVDFVSTNNSGDIVVHFSKIAKFNMLKRVESSIGNAMTISYKNIPSSTIMPQAKWVMDSLWVFDGLLNDGTDYSLTTFDYQGGRYDRYERIFMGYDSVITRSHRDNGVTYRTVVEKYHTNDFLFKGLQFEKAIRDSLDRIYVKNETVYGKYEIIGGAKVNEDSAACFGPYYPAIYKEVSSFFEGGTQSIVTRKQYMYGPLGTVVSYNNHGDTLVATDDLRALISYRNDSSSYIIGLPLGISVFNAQNSLVRHRLATYDIIGQLTNIQVNLGNGSASSDFEYDQYGNVSKMTLPPNAQNQRMFYEYTYDDTVRSYPVRIEDAYGYVSSSKYDFWRGNIIESTDMAGNKVKYTYNANGRLRTIQGPKEIANGQPFTLRFAYWDDYDYKFLWRPLFDDSTRLWARTEHYDEFNAGNTISTVLFADGLGRVVQTKKKSVVDGNEVMVVSGRMKFDEFGRITEQFYPTTEPLGNDSLFNTYWQTSVQPSRVFYDVLDRPTREIQPDATQTFHVYGFGTDQNGVRRFRKTTTDAEGTSVSVLTDPRELQMRIIAPLGAVTDFKYNALGELIESKDPEGFVTTYSYDQAGRRISRMHPDAGQTNWSYDPAGNLVSMANANLIGNGQTVNYSYHFGQLTEVNYPTNPENNVFYAYGNAGNATGRILTMQDAAGVHAFEYGSMGEVTLKKTTGYVPVSGGEFYTFSTRWQYDSWNRVKSIEYPDGELVDYDYDKGGQFVSMKGTKTNTQDYVTDVRYDEFGSRTFFAYGNGTSSTYTYDANSRRLLNLVSTTGNGDMLDLTYTYDDVGNITRINNTATGVNGLGGNYTYNLCL